MFQDLFCSFKLQGKNKKPMFKANGRRTVQAVFTSPSLRPMACSTDVAPDFTTDCSSLQLPTCMVSTCLLLLHGGSMVLIWHSGMRMTVSPQL